ncbi:GIY-YIG nuclease family protein [Maribellus sediminis]|uniref:GIY-YIG nuclease family protein n=1 Tax=Maribellus sediminis TaxID=2696285 RepID=UPI0014321106|nr:GIY-YIG nuclease family protein [Maribellus sediminis]
MSSKKEQKEAYKQMKFQMGVFQIRNLTNNKILIDNSTDIHSKWNRHKMELRFGNHKNLALQHDWNTNGETNFALEILAELKENEEQNVNYQRELKALQKRTVEALNIPEELKY